MYSRKLSVDQLHDWISSGRALQLIDLREAHDFARAHIKRSQHIPIADLETRKHEIAADRPVVLICHNGSRSDSAAAMLASNSLTDVHVVAGGMLAWKMLGFPVQSI